ncbi:MAG: sigma-E factor regulatory protein RseB domain-containing protein [Fluviicoccus sp.]|uniref:LolA family protein n=1 Tax=Fluviicoccus sp. TaxID=2003552 RepID=UPI00271FD91B|nr:sigma-E factor regulatory protein RseB domain-containing protein [Fluviicoccus sp.]MDO8331237.1 sigma-E factor regulatory protein RseB domain-containing protein [Fluviicoccus sp.]
MKNNRIMVLAALLACSACTSIWANSIASKMTDNLLLLESLEGELVQKKILPDAPAVDVRQSVIYQKPWKIRAEVTAPASIKGSLFLYDGNRSLVWWPTELFGMRVSNISSPDRDGIFRHLAHESTVALRDYAFSMSGVEKVAGVDTNLWKVLPMVDDGYHHYHQMWMVERYSIPLKVEILDKDKKLWYGMEYKKASFNKPLLDNAFAFEFPSNAMVIDFDYADPGISLEEARRTMNFTVMQPGKLPDGLKVTKMIRAKGTVPMLDMIMDQGGTRVSLFQSHAFGTTPLMKFGKEVRIGKNKGMLSFTGPFSTIVWIKDKTQLTLIGNLSYPQLLQLAASVE